MAEILSKAERNYLQAYVNERSHYEKYGDLGELTQDLGDRTDSRWCKLSEHEKNRMNDILGSHTYEDIMVKYTISGY